MKRKTINYVRVFNFISAALLLALVVCQLLPFWNSGEATHSIQGYVWFPEHCEDLTSYLKGEFGPTYRINDIITMPLLVIASSLLGLYFCTIKSKSIFSAILPFVCGVAGTLGYLCMPIFQHGSLWGLHLAISTELIRNSIMTCIVCYQTRDKAFEDEYAPVQLEQPVKSPAPVRTSKVVIILTSLLCVITVFLSVFTIILNGKHDQQLKKLEEIHVDISNQQEELKNQKNEINNQKAEIEGQKTEIGKQNEVIQNQANAITKLQELLANGVLDSTGKTTAADLLEMLENNELNLENQDELISALKVLLEQETDDNVVTFKAYTVAAGDNLSKICAANNLDYNANYKIILAINGITDANQIYVGQTLLLPVAE